MSQACLDASVCLMPVDSGLAPSHRTRDGHPRRALPAPWFEFSQCQPLAPSRRYARSPAAPLNPETRRSSQALGTPCRWSDRRDDKLSTALVALLRKRRLATARATWTTASHTQPITPAPSCDVPVVTLRSRASRSKPRLSAADVNHGTRAPMAGLLRAAVVVSRLTWRPPNAIAPRAPPTAASLTRKRPDPPRPTFRLRENTTDHQHDVALARRNSDGLAATSGLAGMGSL